MTVPSKMRSMIESAYVAVQTGGAHSQCTAMQCVFIMYLSRVGAGGDVAWLEPQLKAAIRADAARSGAGSMDARVSTIDLKGMPSYTTQHRKTTMMSLECALQTAERELWDYYCSETFEKLRAHGLPLAAQRLMKVCMQARQQSRDDWSS